MNARQSLKAAAKRCEDMEHQIMLNIRDIRLYVQCIHGMINHKSPCDYCEDHDECEVAGKDITVGCDDWMLKLWNTNEDVKDWQRLVMAGKQTELFAEGGPEDGHQEDDGADRPAGEAVPGGDDPILDGPAVE